MASSAEHPLRSRSAFRLGRLTNWAWDYSTLPSGMNKSRRQRQQQPRTELPPRSNPDPVHNAVNMAELAICKGVSTLLVPVSARKQLNDLPEDIITRINILYYTDSGEALLKAIME